MKASDYHHEKAQPSPLVSVVMANYCGAGYLPAALESVLRQTVDDIEVIVSDDASPDESVAVVQQIMACDPRVRLMVAERNGGPAAARNRALNAARGAWIAIVDSDDIIHPQRLEIMLAAAHRLGADAVADDLLFFSDSSRSSGRTLLGTMSGQEPLAVSAEFFIRSNTVGSGLPPLGYLKPLLRRKAIAEPFYDESVRIGEDYDFLLRFLVGGGRLFLLPEALYLYRRHSASISHRLSEKDVISMIESQEVFKRGRALSPGIAALLEKRMKALRRAASFERLVATLKQRWLLGAVRQVAVEPQLLAPLSRSAVEHFRGRIARGSASGEIPARLVLHPHNTAPTAAHPVHAALGFEDDVEMIPVPFYAPPESGARGGGEPALRIRLARMCGRADIGIVAHGLASLFFLPFLSRTATAWVVVDDPNELELVLAWTTRMPAGVLIADRVLDARPTPLPTAPFCRDYRLAMRETGSARTTDDEQQVTTAR